MQPEESRTLIQRCARKLGMTRGEIIQIARTAPKRYKVFTIPKRNGGLRNICQPSRELKAIQRFFLTDVFRAARVHEAASAYKAGASIRDNAAAHRRSRVILKVDFVQFFTSITVADWLNYIGTNFPEWSEEDVKFSTLVTFWGAGTYEPVCLSIGAPTSPQISNMIMFEFDELMDKFAIGSGLVYTRYADDITISTQGYLDVDATLAQIRAAVNGAGGPKLKINTDKTFVGTKRGRRQVTGLVLTNDGKVSLGRDRKRLISAMVDRARKQELDPDDIMKLHGLLSFASDSEPTFYAALIRKYGQELIDHIQRRRS